MVIKAEGSDPEFDMPDSRPQLSSHSKPISKPKQEKRATRGVKLGNLNENALFQRNFNDQAASLNLPLPL